MLYETKGKPWRPTHTDTFYLNIDIKYTQLSNTSLVSLNIELAFMGLYLPTIGRLVKVAG